MSVLEHYVAQGISRALASASGVTDPIAQRTWHSASLRLLGQVLMLHGSEDMPCSVLTLARRALPKGSAGIPLSAHLARLGLLIGEFHTGQRAPWEDLPVPSSCPLEPRNPATEAVVASMARALFVAGVWAQQEEEQGREHPGENLLDIAPDTPQGAQDHAWLLLGYIEALNATGSGPARICDLLARAAAADGLSAADAAKDANFLDAFGHLLAMEALATGVTWADDHADASIRVPYIEPPDLDSLAPDSDSRLPMPGL